MSDIPLPPPFGLPNIVLAAEYESSPMMVTDAMGREKFWEDAGRPND